MIRVSGHGLLREGRAFIDGTYTGKAVGYGLCECGESSPVFDSTAERQRWHVQHKARVLALGTTE
jgi:hypothetical protein